MVNSVVASFEACLTLLTTRARFSSLQEENMMMANKLQMNNLCMVFNSNFKFIGHYLGEFTHGNFAVGYIL